MRNMHRERTRTKLVGSMELSRATSQAQHKSYHHGGRLLTRTEKILKIGIPCVLLVIGGILAAILLTASRNNGVEPYLVKNELFVKTIYPEKYHEIVVPEATRNRLEPELVYAVIKVESKFEPEAKSTVGALGLMQMTPSTFEWLQTIFPPETPGQVYIAEDLKKPEISIRYGCHYLAWNIERFGDVETALCAYNAGPGIVEKWLADPAYSSDGKSLDYIPYPATQAYVKNVMEAYDTYKKLYTEHQSEVSSQ